ncbi:PQQ-binding-like beta-propeller repeat protein [Planctomycetes bacterium K23_9]|uniref:Outer membrane biogenesis protein BamB n=1 Tax=Stieleria marina TaxID=1930275 RepID=A0A517P3H8_9BACT|nr:outer membrane biogenesis protein BamB [Planctomycetes bacterium K23_9]
MIVRTALSVIAICLALSSAAVATIAYGHDNPFLPADADDNGWTHVRGNHFSGHSAEIHLASDWPSSGPPVLWVKELGQGYSSVVVQNNRAYTQYQTLAGQYVVCMNAATGQTIWTYRYDWPFETAGLYPGPRSTPTLANGKVYFATPAGAVGCLTHGGTLLWQQDLKTKFDGKGTDFGYACSPTVIDGKVIMPVGGQSASMVALDADDGTVLWKSGDSSASYASALPITVAGQPLVIGYMEHDLVAFELELGQQLWQQKLSRGYDEHSSWPIYREPFLWTSAPFQAGSQLQELTGGETPKAELVWQKPILSNDVSSSVLIGDHLYGFDLTEAQTKAHRPSRGSFRCIDFLTGETSWSNGDSRKRRGTDFKVNANEQIVGHASVITADGKLILFNDLGDLILAEADSQAYVELARTPALSGEICWTTPTLDRGRIFLRNHSRVVCLYIGEPELLKQIAQTEVLTVEDIPRRTVRDLSTLLGVEPEYAMDPPTRVWLNHWLLAGLGILLVAAIIAGLVSVFVKNRPTIRWCFWIVSGGLGAFTGTIASHQTQDFVFTWPIIIFVALQVAVYHSRIRRSVAQTSTWHERLIGLGFLLVCFAYFFLCRQLSLVTQWMFLCGFIAAAPVFWIARLISDRQQRWSLLAEFALTLIAYLAFHYATVTLLDFKYDLSEF